MKSVHDPEIGELVQLATERERRKTYGGRTFTSAHFALTWYFEARERMQSPQSVHPRGEQTATGETVLLDVDGGRGGDLHETMVTISSIGAILYDLQKADPHGHGFVILSERDGRSLRQIVDASGIGYSQVSTQLGRAMSGIAAIMRWEGIVR